MESSDLWCCLLTKKFFIDNYGCAKNQVDAEILISHLTDAGWEYAEEAGDSDLIIINSCAFIEDAKKESIQAVLNWRKVLPDHPIMLAGCLGERYGDALLDSLEEVDVIFGNGNLDEIMKAVDATMAKKRQTLIYPQDKVCTAKRKKILSFPGSAYVKVAEGCDNHCSFCAIPSIRGKFRSRPIADVVAEIKALIEQGIYEISLIAQDLASYGHDFPDYKGESEDEPSKLLQLLEAIDALEGRFRIRLLYLHPDNFPRDILTLISESSKFCQYFDIPFQSGSDKILKLMNRRGTVEDYIDLVDEIKFVLPLAVIRTTFMTGFPGETEEDFNATREFLQRIRPMWSGTFCFSPEENTPAEKMTGKVPKSVARERAEILEKDQYDLTRYMLGAFIGDTLDAVVEELIYPPKGGDPCFAICRTYLQAEEVDGVISAAFPPYACTFKPGDVIPVKLISVDGVNVISSPVL